MNIGVVLFCAELGFLKVIYSLDSNRLQALSDDLDVAELEDYCSSFATICRGDKKGGVLETMSTASRFRWLIAKRSTILQVSPVHPGFCSDPEETLDRLMRELVL